MESTLKYAEHKLDEAIKQGETDVDIAYWRGYRDCAKAMTQDHFPDTTKMMPLTLEKLREMDGHPVWVRVSENWRESGIYEGWMLIRFHGKDDRVRAYTYDTRFGATFHAQQDYGISWWA